MRQQQRNRRVAGRRHRLAILPVIVVALVVLAAAGAYRAALSPETDRTIGGPFTLADSRGGQASDRVLRGRFALLFFGYTRCADVCPTTLAVMTTVLDRLDPAAKRIQPVFVSVDPAHDTPARVRDYVGRFSPVLLGLTGTPAQLDRVEHLFHVTVRADDAAVQHSAALYLLGPDGRFRAAIPADIEGAELDALLRRTLAGTG